MPSSAKKAPIVLYTLSTPNGHRPGICLEELKAAYPDAGIEYEVREVDLWGWEHKEDWFIKVLYIRRGFPPLTRDDAYPLTHLCV